MDKRNKALIILGTLVLVFTIIGGTLAYFQWTSNTSQNTAVTFTVQSGFSCSADGGGSITSNDKVLAPAACTNTTYAIKRTITVSPTITQPNKTIYLDLWLKVNSISSNLSASQNFKYALTESGTNCVTDVVAQGNFWLSEANTKRYLLQDKVYSQTTTETYYLWIWLDNAETNTNTMNQSFNIELGGDCTDGATVYTTANSYDEDEVSTGKPIPNTVTKYNSPSAAMTALEDASGNTVDDYPFFLKHKIGNGTLWCLTEYESGVATGSSYCIHSTQAACNANISNWEQDNYTYTCVQNDFTNGVTESYVGFVVTPTMAANNPEMTVGTYYLKGGDNGASYNDNKSVLISAFGSNNCHDYNSEFNCTEYGSYYLDANVSDDGDVSMSGPGDPETGYMPQCYADKFGHSYCQ